MKCINARLTVLALLAVAGLVSAAGAQTWPTYHMDSGRRGQNSGVTTGNPASLGPVWAFPKNVSIAANDTNTINDAPDPGNFVNGLVLLPSNQYPSNQYIAPGVPDISPGVPATPDPLIIPPDPIRPPDLFYIADVISRTEPAWDHTIPALATASWKFPTALTAGKYQISIWVPSDYPGSTPASTLHNTSQAEYTVYDDNGATTIKFDQRNGGGWVLLSNQYFSFSQSGNCRVELSNLTDDPYDTIVDDQTTKTPKRLVLVAADAIRFVQGTGMEIYASPTSAEIDWSCHWTFDDPTTDPPPPGGLSPHGEGDWTGTIPVVYAGSVESQAGGGPDAGTVYCINSITPTTWNISSEVHRTGGVTPGIDYEKWKEYQGLSKFLGTPVWQYPRLPAQRTDELEGPIEGGIYSTPTIVATPDDTVHPLVCYVAGMDRQVYALDAKTGELLWKGPGVTRSEGSPTGWDPASGEAFGGVFHTATCTSSTAGAQQVSWTFDEAVRKGAGEQLRSGEDGWSYAVYAWIPTYHPEERVLSTTPPTPSPRIADATYTITYTGPDGKDATSTITIDQSIQDNRGKWVRLGSSYFNVSQVTLSNLTMPPPPPTGSPLLPENYHVVADAVMIVPDTIDSFSYSTPAWNGKTGTDGRIFAASVSGRVLALKPIQDGDKTYKAGTVEWIYPKVRVTRQPGGELDMDAKPFGAISASPAYDNSSGLLGSAVFVADFDGKIHCLNNLDANTPTEYWRFPGNNFANDPKFILDDPGHFTSSPAVDDRFRQLLIGSTNGNFYCINTETLDPKSIDPAHPEIPPAPMLNWKYPANPATDTAAGDVPLGGFRYATAAIADDSTHMHRAWVGSTDGRVYSFYIGDPANKDTERRIYTEWDDNGIKVRDHVKYYVEPSVLAPIQGSIALDQTSSTTGHPYMFVGDMQDPGSLHWFRADTGISDFSVPGKDNYGNDVPKYYKSYQLEGMLFSSPSIIQTKVGSATVSYIDIGCSDGRVLAFSNDDPNNPGAWGGGWSGGQWPYGGSPNDRRQEQLAPDPDIQFEMITRDVYDATRNVLINNFENPPNPTSTDNFTMPATWNDAWLISKAMKQSTFTASSTDATTDASIDKELKVAAQARRSAANLVFPNVGSRTGTGSGTDSAIYFEWGEKMYLALWNLPARKFLYGGSGGSAFTFHLTNTSPGSNAGSSITVNPPEVQEYHVLQSTAVGIGTDSQPYFARLKYSDESQKGDVRRSYVLAEVVFSANASRPPSPGPGWVLTVDIRTRTSDSTTAPVTSTTMPLARLQAGTPPVPLFIQYEGAPAGVGTFKEQLLGINNPLAIRDDHVESGAHALDAVDPDSIAWEYDFKAGDSTGNAVAGKGRNNPEAHFNGNAAYATLANGNLGYQLGKMPTMNLDIFNFTTDLGVAHGTNSREGKLGIMDRSAMGVNGSKITQFRVDAGDLAWQGDTAAITDALKVNGVGYGVKFPWEFGLGSADYPDIPKKRQTYRKMSDEHDPSRAPTTLQPVVCPPAIPDYNAATMRPDTVGATVDVPRYQPANMTIGANTSGRQARFGYQRTMVAYVDSDNSGTWASGDEVIGRPVTYQEAYRTFMTGLRVPADPKIQVEEQLVDIGQPAHGLGENLETTVPWAPYEFTPVNPNPEVQQWFKKITIKNDGNVNLYNIKIAKLWPDSNGNPAPLPIYMVKDAASLLTLGTLAQSIPGTQISSSLDNDLPLLPFLAPLKADPFFTSGYGYTLTKPRVGDPDPSVLTIPDKRKWDNNYNNTATDAKAALVTALKIFGAPDPETQAATMLPYSTEVSIKIPVSQPIGTYQSPFIPVYCDFDGNNQWSYYPPDLITHGSQSEPMAAPTFQLKATVRESVLTGARMSGCLPQLDDPLPKTNPSDPDAFSRVGDSTPAAYRDPVTGNVRLYWSSNRMFDPGLYPDWTNPNDDKRKDFANAPWLLDQAELKFTWAPNVIPGLPKWVPTWVNAATRWWDIPASDPYIPRFSSNSNLQWPALLPIWDAASDAHVMPWEFNHKDTGFLSVRHYSPVIADNPDLKLTADKNRVWLAWCGMANVLYSEKNPKGDDTLVTKTAQENSLFYVDVTSPGLIKNADGGIQRLKRDPKSEKRHPSLSVFNPGQGADDRMWMFWQGADNDQWSIYYATNQTPGFPSSGWDTEVGVGPNWDLKLVMPSCLASAGSPNAVHRIIGDVPQATGAKQLFDVVYDGVTKLGRTSDVLLTRYAALTNADATAAGLPVQLLPSRGAQPLPRVYREKLQRDSKFGFFTSEHITWIRPNSTGIGKLVLAYFSDAQVADIFKDHLGQIEHDKFAKGYDAVLKPVGVNSRAGLYEFYNMPHVWAVLPDHYKAVLPDGTEEDLGLGPDAIVSATDETAWPNDRTQPGYVPPGDRISFDAATGTVVYKYPKGSVQEKVFGETIADFAAGIIRFKNPLVEKKVTDGSVAVPQVYADYTPQTWRLTTDPAVDNSPRAFIEKTGMNPDANPGMKPGWTGEPPPVDRLWVLWRKAATGANSSTIYWKTYRMGIDLTKLKDDGNDYARPVKWQVPTNGTPPYIAPGDVTVTHAIGPWEVDRLGTHVYFTQIDERYSSLLQSAGHAFYENSANPDFVNVDGNGVGHIVPIEITYTNTEGKPKTVEASEISWIPEAPERSLFGYASDSSVNEGSIYAFSDIANPPKPDGTSDWILSSKIWVFWTSTRAGTSDLCWATLSPSFAAR